MRRSISKRTWIIVAAVAAVLLIGGTIFALQMGDGKTDPYKQTETVNENDTPQTPQNNSSEDTEEEPKPTTPDEEPAPTLDPETVSTIDVPSLEISVAYVKGAGGFEYMVQRTASGTRYVEFRSQDLAGTKCTDDSGPFASILVDPSTDESATLAKKTTVDGTTYGLSLAAATCTSNADLLKQYQASFIDAFSLLKKTVAN